MSIAIHEQAAIQKQLEDIFSQTTDRDGFRAYGSNLFAFITGQSTKEVGNKFRGRLHIGDLDNPAQQTLNLVKDLDNQKFVLPDGGPLAKASLKDIEPDHDTGAYVTIDGQPVKLDGSTVKAKDITGWDTKTPAHDAFQITVAEWEKTNKATPGKPLKNTGAPEWVDYNERMCFIAQLFRLYTFEPSINTLNVELTTKQTKPGGPLAFLPKTARERITKN